ncbi:MAG: hypothetical protein ABI780_03045 [Ardenticatenales bacterium]
MRVHLPLIATTLTALAAATLTAAAPPRRPAVPAALAQAPAGAVRPYVRQVDRWLGETRAVAVDGDRAYYSVGRAIAVADIANVVAPRLLGRSGPLPLAPDEANPPPITDVAAADGYVWAVTRRAEDGVAVFDARDPTRPRLVAQVRLPSDGVPRSVAARGRECIVAVASLWSAPPYGGVWVMRVAPDGRVGEVARWQDPAVPLMPSDVVWVGERVLVSGGPNDVASFALSGTAGGPRSLAVNGYRGGEWPDQTPTHLAVDGCRAYTLAGGGDDGDPVAAFDICRGVTPVQLGNYGASELYERHVSGIAAVTLGGRPYALVGDMLGGVVALDASDPAAATWPATPLVPPVAEVHVCHADVAVADHVVLSTGCGLTTTAIADDSPRALRVGNIFGLAPSGQLWSDVSWRSAAAMAGANAVVVHGNIVQVVDPAAPIAPAVIGRVGIAPGGDTQSFQIFDMAATETAAWIAGVNGSVVAIDLRDPRAPTVAGDLGVGADAITADGHLVAAAPPLSGNAIVLFDVTDPALAREVGRIKAEQRYVGDLVLRHDRLFASLYFGNLTVIDVGDPSDPRILASDPDTYADHVAVDDDVAVTTTFDSLCVYDLAGVADGQLAVTARIPFAAVGLTGSPDLEVDGLELVHAGGRRIALLYRRRPSVLLAVDVTDPAHPVAGVPRSLPIPFEAMASRADRAYLFSGFAGAEFSVFEAGTIALVDRLQLPFLANGGF